MYATVRVKSQRQRTYVLEVVRLFGIEIGWCWGRHGVEQLADASTRVFQGSLF